MNKNNYTIAIMSFSGHNIKTFSVSLFRVILITAIIVGCILSSLCVLSIKLWNLYSSEAQREAEINRKYVELQSDFQKLQRELIRIKKTYQDFRTILGIQPSVNSDFVPKVSSDLLSGKGGSKYPGETFETMPYSDEIAFEIKSEIKNTMREAIILRFGLQDLIETMSLKIAQLSKIPSICPILSNRSNGYYVSSWFGPRISPFTGLWEFHTGLDIAASFGAPIVSTADGVVSSLGYNSLLGNYVTIRHNDEISTVYGHMSRYAEDIAIGTEVKRYDIIGYVGSTGRSTGPHVHYEVRYNGRCVDPFDYILN